MPGIAVSKPMIVNALRSIGPGEIRTAVDTHWHWDHADGNEWVRVSGADIIADRNALKRLTQTIRVVEWEHTFTPKPRRALPNVAITGDRVIRAPTARRSGSGVRPGHTDGDMSVYFEKADVLQSAEHVLERPISVYRLRGGGSINGAIAAANANLAMSSRTRSSCRATVPSAIGRRRRRSGTCWWRSATGSLR